jgi:uridine kinase
MQQMFTSIDLTTTHGHRVYQRTAILLLCMAAQKAMPDSRVSVEHSLSNGVYCEIHDKHPLTPRDLVALEHDMRELVKQALSINIRTYPRSEAVRLLLQSGNRSGAALLQQMNVEHVDLTECHGYHDYLSGPVLANSSLVCSFRLNYYLPGLILQIPEDNSGQIPVYREQPKLASVYREAERWAKILNVGDVASVNEIIRRKEAGDLIRVAEALYEKRIAAVADQIAQNSEIRLITIAGPSSSGKTTSAQRLKIHLRVNGLHPVTISLDDYFLSRHETPLGDDGKPDFEALGALDLPLLGEHLSRLIQGEPVDVPLFDFHTGQRSNQTRRMQISDDQPIIIEGIHGLNEQLTASVPRGHKFKIYISALTQNNIHDHVRIHTTDVRLIRRMVRDHQFRSHPAENTIKMWPMVRRGEVRNIFPFQEEADVMINSALVYELPVLREKAEPLLQAIPKDSPVADVAEQLLWLLRHYEPLESDEIPHNSILREFVGGSCFM